jgi:hypothetical protein
VDDAPRPKRQGAGCCDTGILLPFITRTADRSIAAGFSATTTLIDASPCPALGVTCTHDALLSIDHVHSRLAEIVAVRRAADAGSEGGRSESAG